MPTAIGHDNKSFGTECLEFLDKGINIVADVGVSLFAEPEGLAYITDLFLSIISALEKLKIFKAGEGLSKFVKTITPLSTFLGCTILFIDLDDWVKQDDDGKYLIDKAWQKIAEKGIWTFSHLFDLLSWVEEFKPGFLTPVATPLAIVDAAIKTVGCVMGIWANLRTIHQTYKKRCYQNLTRRIRKWETRENAWALSERRKITDTKLNKWTKIYEKSRVDRASKANETDKEKQIRHKAKLKVRQWTMIKSCSKDELARFCQSKTQRLKDQRYNRELKINRSVANIALYVATIALIILTAIATLAGVGGGFLPFLLIGLPIVIGLFDLGHYLINRLMTKKKLHELKIAS